MKKFFVLIVLLVLLLVIKANQISFKELLYIEDQRPVQTERIPERSGLNDGMKGLIYFNVGITILVVVAYVNIRKR